VARLVAAVAVLQRDVDVCADEAPVPAAAHELVEAHPVAPSAHRVPRDQARARHRIALRRSRRQRLPGYFRQRFGPFLGSLLEAATTNGEIRGDISPEELLHAVANL
jgi:hypothetical protein